ncbi:hypothetical protein LCGC14_1252340 [marine sediment metagenome]|uniref:Methyltransferase type 11 domain-containing protein n=1 Tax=marine sediment metagenome TaxID=412755 RepID=A0A0F9L2T0_9ZZZZ
MKDYIICNSLYEKIGNVEKVLDIGCGGGYLVNCLAKKLNRKVTGFDISNEGFTKAHEKCKRFGTCNLIECVKGDAHSITRYFQHKNLDVVTLIYTLHHIEKPAIVLRQIAKILKDGGKIVIGDYWFTQRKKKRDCFRFTVRDIRKLLKKSEFRYLGEDRIGKNFVIIVGEK